MDFDLSSEQIELRELVIDFARKELKSDDLAKDERDLCFRREQWQALAKLGLLGLPMPEEYGGTERDLLTTSLAMEALGYACPNNGLIFSLNAHLWSGQIPILKFGSQEQKDRYLRRMVQGELIAVHAITEETSGSDAFNLRTRARATQSGFVLSGSKCFITNAPVADLVIVFATEDPDLGTDGVSAFLVDRGTPGFRTSSAYDKLGLRTSPMGEIFLDDCEIPASQRLGGAGAGSAIFNSSMDNERACILAANVGTLERQLEECIERAKTRERFGQAIGKFQAISNKIADMKVRLETARLLLYRAVSLRASGKRASMESAMAKLYVSECMVRSSLDAVQIFGADGYMTEMGVERNLRDAIGGTIYSGTSEIQRMIIARYLGL
ncbi:MAG: acyl-CoA dehydrogenase family protein [Betaproteobacteria bacterium]|nr:acyl-CoA dehydrogenase family protein [Betaproteobacteria bacterium]